MDTEAETGRTLITSSLQALGWENEPHSITEQRGFTLPNMAEIIGKFGHADRLRNAVNELQSLLYSTAPVAEQTRIVAEVERRSSVMMELAAVVSADSNKSHDSVLQHATRLRQSILQRAFTGGLCEPNRIHYDQEQDAR